MLQNKRSKYRSGDIVLSEQAIGSRLQELAKEIGKEYRHKEFLIIGILKGACVLVADLQRALYRVDCKNFQLSFITLKSYFSNKTSSKKPQLVQDSDIDPKGKHVLIVDEIIDTGVSFSYIAKHMKKRGAASVRTFALLSKPERREVQFEPDYIGFTVPDIWLEGYGMDSAESGRGNPNIIVRVSST